MGCHAFAVVATVPEPQLSNNNKRHCKGHVQSCRKEANFATTNISNDTPASRLCCCKVCDTFPAAKFSRQLFELSCVCECKNGENKKQVGAIRCTIAAINTNLQLKTCTFASTDICSCKSRVVAVTASRTRHQSYRCGHRTVVRKQGKAQELCESRGGRPGLPVPNSPYGHCGRKATLNSNPGTVSAPESRAGGGVDTAIRHPFRCPRVMI